MAEEQFYLISKSTLHKLVLMMYMYGRQENYCSRPRDNADDHFTAWQAQNTHLLQQAQEPESIHAFQASFQAFLDKSYEHLPPTDPRRCIQWTNKAILRAISKAERIYEYIPGTGWKFLKCLTYDEADNRLERRNVGR